MCMCVGVRVCVCMRACRCVYCILDCDDGVSASLVFAKRCCHLLPGQKIETTARTWHRRVICRACTRLCLACVPVSIFLARVVNLSCLRALVSNL